MSVNHRDPLSGHQTTGHIWNGITELNTKVPRAIWLFIIVTHLYALIWWVLFPAWPLGVTYTEGLIGYDEHAELEQNVQSAADARAEWENRILASSRDEIHADPVLMNALNETAPTLFGDNCSVCHGSGAAGGPGFPSLIDGAWLWGGDEETIMETLRVGINSSHPDTRYAEMLAFGRDGMLSRDEVRTVAAYVQSLSGAEIAPDAQEAGAELFMDNCASCHGEDGTGMTEMGAPNLTDDFWIYGGDDETLFRTIYGGRQGWMPAWEDRLSEAERKMLTVYIQDLGAEAAR